MTARKTFAQRVQELAGLEAYLATLQSERLGVLEVLAREAGQSGVEAFAVHLLRQSLAAELARRTGATVRRKLRDEQFARRWAHVLARILNYGKSREAVYLVINAKTGQASPSTQYPESVPAGSSVVKVDWEELRDEAGAITSESVGAWLTGRARPKGQPDGTEKAGPARTDQPTGIDAGPRAIVPPQRAPGLRGGVPGQGAPRSGGRGERGPGGVLPASVAGSQLGTSSAAPAVRRPSKATPRRSAQGAGDSGPLV